MLDTRVPSMGRVIVTERDRLPDALNSARTGLLEEVFCKSPSFLHVLQGPEFVFEMANDAYYQLVGHRELIGRPAFEALPEAANGGFQELIARVMTTREPFIGRELPVTLVRTPGMPPEERLIDLIYLPLIDADGSCTRILGHGTDVTDHVLARRKAEEALRVSEALAARTAAAEAANQAKSEFLAIMSHELRTPLNAIAGYAELIELGIYGAITSDQATAIARIQRSQQHLLNLISEVLNYARLEGGTVQYNVADVELEDVLATCEALIDTQVRAKGLTLQVGCEHELRSRADRDKVTQIVLNLLSNAVKFTDPGGWIDVTAAAVQDEVRITVADTGRGIAADQLDRMFEPFAQVDSRLTRTRDGVGLGLAISRDLARGMGGELTAASRPAVGSTFTLVLPAP
jgi:signal transduction histidine kinase